MLLSFNSFYVVYLCSLMWLKCLKNRKQISWSIWCQRKHRCAIGFRWVTKGLLSLLVTFSRIIQPNDRPHQRHYNIHGSLIHTSPYPLDMLKNWRKFVPLLCQWFFEYVAYSLLWFVNVSHGVSHSRMIWPCDVIQWKSSWSNVLANHGKETELNQVIALKKISLALRTLVYFRGHFTIINTILVSSCISHSGFFNTVFLFY